MVSRKKKDLRRWQCVTGQKILIGIFCLGIVLAELNRNGVPGIFPPSTYAGEKEAGEMDRETLTLDYALRRLRRRPYDWGGNYGRYANNNEVIESEAVPGGTQVRFLTYNAKCGVRYLNKYK